MYTLLGEKDYLLVVVISALVAKHVQVCGDTCLNVSKMFKICTVFIIHPTEH